jgi:glycosyltransferase involved in cell wall biosynthesis
MESSGWARPGEKLLVYAVRGVPRKNLSEALLLTRLLNLLSSGQGGIPHALQPDGPFRLVVAISPEEPKFRRYTEMLQEFVERNNFEAKLGLGGLITPQTKTGPDGKVQTYGVAELYAAGAAAITTSVLEGFGFGFLEPWCAGRVVIGRRLCVVDDFIREGLRMEHFYRRLAVDNRDFRILGEPPSPLFAPVSNDFNEAGMAERLEFIRTLDGGSRLGHFLTENRWPVERMLEALVRPNRLVNSNRERAFEAYSPKRLTPRLLAVLRGQSDPGQEA